MSSVLIWSIESVVLGLWALVFSSYSTPLHVFVARSHVLISSFTLLLHLIVVARDLVIGSAVSQAFLCAISALFLTYVSTVLADDGGSKYFKMPSVGLLKLDACIGLAWFTVVLFSGVGMALSFVKKELPQKKAKSTPLMFNSYGFHLVVICPCLAIAHQAASGIVCITGLTVWGIHIAYLALQLGGVDLVRVESNASSNGPSLALRLRQLFFYAIHIVVRYAALAITITVLISVNKSSEQFLLVACLLALSALRSLDVVYPIYLKYIPAIPGIPAFDVFFGREWGKEHGSSDVDISDTLVGARSAAKAMLRFPDLTPLRISSDPAGVTMQRRSFMDDRAKMV